VESLAPKAWQYGVLGIVALGFAIAIVHLFRALRAEAARAEENGKAQERERAAWTIKERQLEADYERRVREQIELHSEQLRAVFDASREREDQIRIEFAEIMERVEAEATKTSDRLVEMLQKFYDRFVGPSRSGRY
jgi:Asp-tRNA(Asn)/Glu-tRNA(Gln) amidotransferase A subunit family amidase